MSTTSIHVTTCDGPGCQATNNCPGHYSKDGWTKLTRTYLGHVEPNESPPKPITYDVCSMSCLLKLASALESAES